MNCDVTKKTTLGPKSKTQIVTNFKASKCENTTKKQMMTKLKNSNYDQTKKKLILTK